ncbi:uncharacterized protein LOC131890922 [Tigriopus californicus]|uniref:uncharacterized protein LOC131890922 n=1 Tax=Tigriopus californicus TaxID=6832 RepID=UPI0027DA6833|nr:uncharacterized protein LOC131890922 [Tigriopus californicus]
MTIYHSYSIIISYLRHPFVTKFSMMPQDKLLFPFVAISTTRKVNCNKLENLLENVETLSDSSFGSYCWLYHSCQCEVNRSDLIQKCNTTTNGKMVEWGNNSEPNVERSLNDMSTSWKSKFLSHPKDFVVQVKWDGEIFKMTSDCSKDLFCFGYYHSSLQLLVNYYGILKADKIGKEHCLEISLKVPSANPARHGVLNDMDGFIVDFAPPKYISGAKRIIVQPGTSVSMSLREVQHKKLAAPFESKCIHAWEESFFHLVPEIIRQVIAQGLVGYHQESCHAICRMNHLVEKCNCTWARISVVDIDKSYHITPKCEEYKSDVWNCLKKNDLDLNDSRKICNCQMSCDLISYDVTVSSSKWPSMEFWQNAAKTFGGLDDNYTKSTNPISQTMMKNNIMGKLARVTIFFDSNQRILIEEIAKFESFWAFFITWGGAMSIYLGISFMTLAGLILSLYEKIVHFCVNFE